MRGSVSKLVGQAVAGGAIVMAMSGVVRAESATAGLTCEGYATMAADIATHDIMQRAKALDTNKPDSVLMIAAGRKFYVPARQLDQATLAPISAYDRLSAWNAAYRDAYHACRHADSITFDVKK